MPYCDAVKLPVGSPSGLENVTERIRRVLKFANPEKLSLNPDCGFGWSPRATANQKLRALAAGARIVRKELTGSE